MCCRRFESRVAPRPPVRFGRQRLRARCVLGGFAREPPGRHLSSRRSEAVGATHGPRTGAAPQHAPGVSRTIAAMTLGASPSSTSCGAPRRVGTQHVPNASVLACGRLLEPLQQWCSTAQSARERGRGGHKVLGSLGGRRFRREAHHRALGGLGEGVRGEGLAGGGVRADAEELQARVRTAGGGPAHARATLVVATASEPTYPKRSRTVARHVARRRFSGRCPKAVQKLPTSRPTAAPKLLGDLRFGLAELGCLLTKSGQVWPKLGFDQDW